LFCLFLVVSADAGLVNELMDEKDSDEVGGVGGVGEVGPRGGGGVRRVVVGE
jgi:hypothetical protein